jgi:hypothetical protein
MKSNFNRLDDANDMYKVSWKVMTDNPSPKTYQSMLKAKKERDKILEELMI